MNSVANNRNSYKKEGPDGQGPPCSPLGLLLACPLAPESSLPFGWTTAEVARCDKVSELASKERPQDHLSSKWLQTGRGSPSKPQLPGPAPLLFWSLRFLPLARILEAKAGHPEVAGRGSPSSRCAAGRRCGLRVLAAPVGPHAWASSPAPPSRPARGAHPARRVPRVPGAPRLPPPPRLRAARFLLLPRTSESLLRGHLYLLFSPNTNIAVFRTSCPLRSL